MHGGYFKFVALLIALLALFFAAENQQRGGALAEISNGLAYQEGLGSEFGNKFVQFYLASFTQLIMMRSLVRSFQEIYSKMWHFDIILITYLTKKFY